MRLLSGASCRCRPLSSNVRPHKACKVVRQQNQRLSACVKQPQRGKAANHRSVHRCIAFWTRPHRLRSQTMVGLSPAPPELPIFAMFRNQVALRSWPPGRKAIQITARLVAASTVSNRSPQCSKGTNHSLWHQKHGMLSAVSSLTLPRAVRPNHSFKRSANGMSRWSSSAGPSAHSALAVQRAMPLSPA